MADEPSQLHQLRALMAGLEARQRERARLLAQLRTEVEQASPPEAETGDSAGVDPIPPAPADPDPVASAAPRPTGWRRWLGWWGRRQSDQT